MTDQDLIAELRRGAAASEAFPKLVKLFNDCADRLAQFTTEIRRLQARETELLAELDPFI